MTMKREVSITVNGQQHHSHVEPRMLLVHYLRDVLDLTGTHIVCDTSQCGACTVLLDGASVKACTVLAVQADGSEVTTIEGIAPEGGLHPIQEGFWEKHGLQCGFCTPFNFDHQAGGLWNVPMTSVMIGGNCAACSCAHVTPFW